MKDERAPFKGFTLIELLVVIAIISLLMAILVPTLQRVGRQAKAVVCRSNLRQWGVIFTSYADTYDGRLPIGEYWSYGISWPWFHVMKDYCRDGKDITSCPMAAKPACPQGAVMVPSLGSSKDLRGGTFHAWGALKVQIRIGLVTKWRGSYGVNNWVFDPPEADIFWVPSENFWKTCTIKQAARVPMMADSWWWSAKPRFHDPPPDYPDQRLPFPCECRNSMNRFCVDRHDGYINSLFMDSSARRVGLKELWTLKWHREYETRGPWTKGGHVRREDWPEWMRKYKDY